MIGHIGTPPAPLKGLNPGDETISKASQILDVSTLSTYRALYSEQESFNVFTMCVLTKVRTIVQHQMDNILDCSCTCYNAVFHLNFAKF